MFWKKKPKPPTRPRTTESDKSALATLVMRTSILLELDQYQVATLIADLENDPIPLSTPLSNQDFAAVLNRAEEWFVD